MLKLKSPQRASVIIGHRDRNLIFFSRLKNTYFFFFRYVFENETSKILTCEEFAQRINRFLLYIY